MKDKGLQQVLTPPLRRKDAETTPLQVQASQDFQLKPATSTKKNSFVNNLLSWPAIESNAGQRYLSMQPLQHDDRISTAVLPKTRAIPEHDRRQPRENDARDTPPAPRRVRPTQPAPSSVARNSDRQPATSTKPKHQQGHVDTSSMRATTKTQIVTAKRKRTAVTSKPIVERRAITKRLNPTPISINLVKQIPSDKQTPQPIPSLPLPDRSKQQPPPAQKPFVTSTPVKKTDTPFQYRASTSAVATTSHLPKAVLNELRQVKAIVSDSTPGDAPVVKKEEKANDGKRSQPKAKPQPIKPAQGQRPVVPTAKPSSELKPVAPVASARQVLPKLLSRQPTISVSVGKVEIVAKAKNMRPSTPRKTAVVRPRMHVIDAGFGFNGSG